MPSAVRRKTPGEVSMHRSVFDVGFGAAPQQPNPIHAEVVNQVRCASHPRHIGAIRTRQGNVGIFAWRALLRAILSAGLLYATPCPAQVPRGFDGAPSKAERLNLLPSHGGDVRMAGPFWLELIVAKGSLTLYVTDHSGAPVDTSHAKGTATVHTDGKATRVELQSAGGNRLVGRGNLRLKHSTVVFVTADLRGQKPHRAVFRPLEQVTADGER